MNEAQPESDARARAAALEHEVARLRGILRQARAIIVTTDLEGRITELNETAKELLGVSGAEVTGQSADRFYVGGRTRERLLERLEKDGSVQADVQVRVGKRGRRRRWLNLSLAWLYDPEGNRIGTVGVSHDVTERRELEEKLRRLSITDKLTGLYNQSHFFHRLEIEKERAIRLGHSLALLLFDLDGFKQLNDTEGHREGDEVLVQVGRVLFQNVRKEVDSAFRYGGDEFTVLLPGATPEQAVGFADRVRRGIEGLGRKVYASMGICPFDRTNRSLQIVELADQAMYLAKRAGGNRIARFDMGSRETVLV